MSRHDWTTAEVEGLFARPFLDLLLEAQRVHRFALRAQHRADEHAAVDQDRGLSRGLRLLSAERALRPGLPREALLEVAAVRDAAQQAKAAGATRFCMGAAYRSPKARDLAVICAMVSEVRALGMETCATLGMLEPAQAQQLKERRFGLLQPQSGHLRGVLRRDHHHPHLPGPARHAVRGTRCRSQVCCGASSAWARPRATAPRCWPPWPACRSTRRAYPSTSWCRCRAPRCTASQRWIPSISSAPSPWRASCCSARMCGCRPGAPR